MSSRNSRVNRASNASVAAARLSRARSTEVQDINSTGSAVSGTHRRSRVRSLEAKYYPADDHAPSQRKRTTNERANRASNDSAAARLSRARSTEVRNVDSTGSAVSPRRSRVRSLEVKCCPADDHAPSQRKGTTINERFNQMHRIITFDMPAQRLSLEQVKQHAKQHAKNNQFLKVHNSFEEPDDDSVSPRVSEHSKGTAVSITESMRSLESRKTKLRMGTHRLHPSSLENEDDIELGEPPKPKPVKRDIWGHLQQTPRNKPGDREMMFKPEHVNRQAVFKEDCQKAAKSEDLRHLLAVYSMALDLDAFLANPTLMLATRHEVEALKKQVRKVVKARVDTAVKADTIDSFDDLKAVFAEIQSDNLMKALTKFPEVYRGWAFLRLRVAEEDVETAQRKNGPTKEQLDELEKTIKKAKRVHALELHTAIAEKLLVRARDPLADPASPDRQPEAEDEDYPEEAEVTAVIGADQMHALGTAPYTKQRSASLRSGLGGGERRSCDSISSQQSENGGDRGRRSPNMSSVSRQRSASVRSAGSLFD